MVGHLSFRLFQDADFPALQRLWEEETDWGPLTHEVWRQWYLKTPYGTTCIVLATDSATGQLAGQFAFIPSLVSVNGREVPALRPLVPIIAKRAARIRSINPFDHPVVAMYEYAVRVLQARYGIIYMVPDPRWLRFHRLFPMLLSGSFPLWSLRLPLASPLSLGDGYSAAPLEGWDQRVDLLWSVASRLYGCSVVRDSRTLPWKIGSGIYSVTAVERAGELVGLVVSRPGPHKEDRQWLVCDLLAADGGDALRATLVAVCNLAQAAAGAAPEETPIEKVAVLVTPAMEPVVRELGFVRDAYDFPLVIQILDPAIAREDVAPRRWYVSAND